MTPKILLYPLLGLALALGGCAKPGTDAATQQTVEATAPAPAWRVVALGSANVIAPGANLPLGPGDQVARLGSGQDLGTASYTIAVVPRGLLVDVGDTVEISQAGPGGPVTVYRVIGRP